MKFRLIKSPGLSGPLVHMQVLVWFGALGLVGAVGLTRFLAAWLYEVKPADPIIFVMVPGFLLLVSLAASVVPALRATRIDPAIALRNQ